jgi:hypothetical protein
LLNPKAKLVLVGRDVLMPLRAPFNLADDAGAFTEEATRTNVNY